MKTGEIKSDDEQSKGPKVEYCKGDAGGLVIASTFNIQTELVGLVREMSDAYKKYPLLCKRGTSAEDEAADDSKNYKNTKKRKKHRPKKHQIKSAMKMKRKKKCSGEDAGDLKQHLNDSECHRCVAVAYNKSTRRIGYGMSGQFKKVKIHPSIWGKSLVAGRPRGTCAEFRVVNEALTKGELASDLIFYVADIMTAEPKPRCRNCVYLTRDATVLSDDLRFDGNFRKTARR